MWRIRHGRGSNEASYNHMPAGRAGTMTKDEAAELLEWMETSPTLKSNGGVGNVPLRAPFPY